MSDKFLLDQSLLLVSIVVFCLLFLFSGFGYFAGKRHSARRDVTEKREKTVGTITGAILALLGFMLAVSLSMADSSFQSRRKLVLEEANAISTSSLRAQGIGGAHGSEIVRLLGDYTRLRLEFFASGRDQERLKDVYTRTSALQQRIWEHASSISRGAATPISALLLSSLNEVFDLSTERRWVLEVRVPPYIIRVLIAFSLLSMATMGYYFGICGVRHTILSLLLIVALTVTTSLILDLDRPRSGLIRPEQRPLIWLLEGMQGQPESEGARNAR
jgi:hypothetical protein